LCFCYKFEKKSDRPKEIDSKNIRESVGERLQKHLKAVQEISKKTNLIPKSLKDGYEKSNATLNEHF